MNPEFLCIVSIFKANYETYWLVSRIFSDDTAFHTAEENHWIDKTVDSYPTQLTQDSDNNKFLKQTNRHHNRTRVNLTFTLDRGPSGSGAGSGEYAELGERENVRRWGLWG